MKAIGIFLLLLVWQTSFSQWTDHFDDGNFTINPSWNGNATDFIVENGILRLSAPAVTGSTYLSTNSDILNDAIWEFSVLLDFNPSSSNYVKIYLVASQSNLLGELEGYHIKIGGTNDDIRLYRQDGSTESLLIDGQDSRVSLTQVEINIQVTRSSEGEWEVLSKLVAENDWIQEGVAMDYTYIKSAYLGFACFYTSTRANKFYFDNFKVSGSPYKDNEAPSLDSVYALSQDELILIFNEALNPTSVSPGQFMVNGFIPNEVKVDSNRVNLKVTEALLIKNELEILEVADRSGNILFAITYPFIFYAPIQAKFGDIIINEIMADPSPVEDLPEIEYLEIVNTSTSAIYMTNWSLSDQATSIILPQISILPDSIIVLYPANKAIVPNYLNSVGLEKWPSLNNSVDSISLADSTGRVIDWVKYDHSWYNDELKEDGGWSLERIDPRNLCSIGGNWQASNDLRGGTPGQINSVFSPTKDTTPAIITGALALSSDTVILEFSESLGLLLPQISIQPFDSLATYLIGTDRQQLLALTPTIEPRIEHLLKAENIYDCLGNISKNDSVYFVVPEPAASGDLVVSEILFNPRPDGVDFIEVYNASPKYISLNSWSLSNEGSSKHIAFKGLIEPNMFKVFTSVPDIIANEYPNTNYQSLIHSEIPVLDNDEGSVVLKNQAGLVIDSVNYNEGWHFSYLEDVEGVSLERISAFRSGTESGNWASASYLDNYATPGYQNSQTTETNDANPVTIDPQVIVPDANGIDDFTQIIIDIDAANAMATINIFNLQGQLIMGVANNALISSSAAFTWDGTDQQGAIVPLGHYVVVITTVLDTGVTATYREKVVVGTGF